MNADRIDYYANLMRGVAEKDIGRKIREILFDATNEAEKVVNSERESLIAENAMMREALLHITKQPHNAGLACRVIADKALSVTPKK